MCQRSCSELGEAFTKMYSYHILFRLAISAQGYVGLLHGSALGRQLTNWLTFSGNTAYSSHHDYVHLWQVGPKIRKKHRAKNAPKMIHFSALKCLANACIWQWNLIKKCCSDYALFVLSRTALRLRLSAVRGQFYILGK